MENRQTHTEGYTISRGGGYAKGVYNNTLSDQGIEAHIYGLLWAIVIIIVVLTIFNTVCCLIFLNIKFSISRDGRDEVLIFKEDVIFKENALYNDKENTTLNFDIFNDTQSSLDKICNINIYNETKTYYDNNVEKQLNYLFFNKTQLNMTIPGSVTRIDSNYYECDVIDIIPILKELILSISQVKSLINETQMNP